MIDLMLLGGSALCAISVMMAVVSVLQARAPRGAAIVLMLGFIVLFVAARMDPAAINPQNMAQTWQRLLAGQISFQDSFAPAAADLTQ